MRYRCVACSRELIIASSSAWPERCPYCHAAPLHTSSGLLSPPLTLAPGIGAGGASVGGVEAIAAELQELAHDAGNEAA